MKKKLLFTLVLMLAASLALSAQDMEQTAAPSFVTNIGDHIYHDDQAVDYADFYAIIYNFATIENNDESDVTIYFRYDNGYGEHEWQEYANETIYCMGTGEATVEAYAVAAGKLPSETVCITVYHYEELLYSAALVDGIHYYIEHDGSHWENPISNISVCSKKESQLYSQPYSGDIVVPSEVIIRDETFTVTGIRSGAFASRYDSYSAITSVELPATIEYVEQSAFSGCTSLKRMIVHATTPPYAGELFEDGFDDESYGYYDYIGFDGATLYDQVTLFVPNESVEDYKSAWEWKLFSHIIPFVGAGPGDVNGDGVISVKDATDLVDQLLNGEELPLWMDVSGDGTVSIFDITTLIDMLLAGN